MRHLILIRHGETDKNLNKKLHIKDDPEKLNTFGILQMKKVAKALKSYIPFKIFCSKELRAKFSAGIIADKYKLKITQIKGLEERNWGDLSDKSWLEIQKTLDSMSLDERFKYKPKRGESWQEFETRLIRSIKRVVESGESNVVVVTHGGAIRALMPYLLNVYKEESFKYDPSNASLSIFKIYKSKFKAVAINQTSHLFE